jgi:hypothetical protein
MPLPPAFKTDESFLEKIAMGATATRRTMEDLAHHGHRPLELERGSTSYKIWKRIKIKRIRVPDILCLSCGRRVESRGKSKLEITMSHSSSNPARGWDAGLDDEDHVALVACEKAGEGPLDWRPSEAVQYIPVRDLRAAFRDGQVKSQRPKGAQEGFEVRVTWPAAVADAPGIVEAVDAETIVIDTEGGQRRRVRLRRGMPLTPVVAAGERVEKSRIVAAVVPVQTAFPCPGGATLPRYVELTRSASLADRYTAAKALGHFQEAEATQALRERLEDEREHVYVRLEAAAGLLRRGAAGSGAFFEERLRDDYLERRLEAVIVLGEVPTAEAVRLLLATLGDHEQSADVRAGAAWALGSVGGRDALPALIATFRGLELAVKIEAARALARMARRHLPEVLAALPRSTPEERPGIAWALSKAGGFTIADVLPALVDEDARHWVAYVVGTQDQGRLVAGVEDLARRDPEVYFAVTVLWKILSSWVYGLEEY